MAPTRRKAVKPVSQPRSNLKNQMIVAATGPTARAAYAVIGTVGLAALAIAIFGPRRFQREILKPVQSAVSDQTSQLWSDSRGLREQISTLFARAGNDRDRLVKNFQSWVGHFRAT